MYGRLAYRFDPRTWRRELWKCNRLVQGYTFDFIIGYECDCDRKLSHSTLLGWTLCILEFQSNGPRELPNPPDRRDRCCRCIYFRENQRGFESPKFNSNSANFMPVYSGNADNILQNIQSPIGMLQGRLNVIPVRSVNQYNPDRYCERSPAWRD